MSNSCKPFKHAASSQKCTSAGGMSEKTFTSGKRWWEMKHLKFSASWLGWSFLSKHNPWIPFCVLATCCFEFRKNQLFCNPLISQSMFWTKILDFEVFQFQIPNSKNSLRSFFGESLQCQVQCVWGFLARAFHAHLNRNLLRWRGWSCSWRATSSQPYIGGWLQLLVEQTKLGQVNRCLAHKV